MMRAHVVRQTVEWFAEDLYREYHLEMQEAGRESGSVGWLDTTPGVRQAYREDARAAVIVELNALDFPIRDERAPGARPAAPAAGGEAV